MVDHPTFDGDSSNYRPGPSWFTRPHGAPVCTYYGPTIHFEDNGKLAAELMRMMHEKSQNGKSVEPTPETIQRIFTARIELYRGKQARHDASAENTLTRFQAIEDIIQALEWLQSDFAAAANRKG